MGHKCAIQSIDDLQTLYKSTADFYSVFEKIVPYYNNYQNKIFNHIWKTLPENISTKLLKDLQINNSYSFFLNFTSYINGTNLIAFDAPFDNTCI